MPRIIRNKILRELHKLCIARLYLIDNNAKDNALETGDIRISDEHKVYIYVDSSKSIYPFDVVLKDTATTIDLSSII